MEKNLEIEIIIGANTAKMGQFFGPILGQYGINIKLFCDKFNDLTKFIYVGIPLRIIIIVYNDKNFDIKIKGFLRKFLLYFYLRNNKKISLSQIYNILILEENLNLILNNKIKINYKSEIKNIINYLKINNIKLLK